MLQFCNEVKNILLHLY